MKLPLVGGSSSPYKLPKIEGLETNNIKIGGVPDGAPPISGRDDYY